MRLRIVVVALAATSAASAFTSQDTVIAATYFYWYDAYTKQSTVYEGGRSAFRHTPIMPEDYSYRSVAWHQRHMRDMVTAGIDVMLPVYWGDPTRRESWSFEGIEALVLAQREMLAAGERPPKIGLFHACIQLSWGPDGPVDLREPAGREWFYATIRDYWAMVPPDLRATIDGKAVMFLYAASYAKGHDQGAIDYARERFARNFDGAGLYIVRGDGWDVDTEARYGWGAAVKPIVLDVAAIGPGYDDSVVPGRKPLIVDRRGGEFYRESWGQLLRMSPEVRPRLVHIETWNELHEGTEICEMREFGRLYIDLTRKYGDLYRAGVRLPRGGPWGHAKAVSWDGARDRGAGLRLLPEIGDGPSEPGERGGYACRVSRRNPYGIADLMYFDLDRSFAFYEYEQPYVVRLCYFDGGKGELLLEYDSNDPAGSIAEGAFQLAGTVELEGTNTWRECTFRLEDARFSDRTHGGDFRVGAIGTPVALAWMRVSRGPTLSRAKTGDR